MAYETIVTVYDTEEHAKEAVRALEAEGFSSNEISLLNKSGLNSQGTAGTPTRDPGFWGKLFGSGVREHEAEVYGRAVDEGGYVVSLWVADTDVGRAMRVLDTNKSVDVDERATTDGLNPTTSRPLSERTAGAGGVMTDAAVAAVGAIAGATGRPEDTAVPGTDAVADTGRAAAGRVTGAGPNTRTTADLPETDTTADTGRMAAGAVAGADSRTAADLPRTNLGGTPAMPGEDQVIRLAEEQLKVGKRRVEAGTTRIRRFVTERPVEEQVSLHEEHAEVMCRAVSDPNYLGDVDWSDKTIEVREMAEEAVVNKTTRLAEEVVVKKKVSHRVEVVRDTVRRQEVEVEHLDADKIGLKTS